MASTLELPKLVRYFPDERLELDDVDAMQSLWLQLLDIDFRALLGEGLGYGWIFQGFNMTGAAYPGLTASLDLVLGVAYDSEGRVILNPGLNSITVSLAPLATNYVHLYVANVESDQDGRRRYDRIAAVENSVTEETRWTPTFGLFVDVAPRTHTMINGQTVPLIPLYTFTTDAIGITGSGDARIFFGDEDAAFVFPVAGDEGKGISSLHAMHSAYAKRLLEITDPAGAWWDQGAVRDVKAIDDEVIRARGALDALTPYASLVEQLEAMRRSTFTTGEGGVYAAGKSLGDYLGSTQLQTLLQRADALAGGDYIVKKGTYSNFPSTTISNRNGLHLIGTPGSKSALGTNSMTKIVPLAGVGNKLTLSNCFGVVVEGFYFDASGIAGEWQLLVDTCSEITFKNCVFSCGAGVTTGATEGFLQIKDSSNIFYDECQFLKAYPAGVGPFMLKTEGACGKVLITNSVFEIAGNMIRSEGTCTSFEFFKNEVYFAHTAGASPFFGFYHAVAGAAVTVFKSKIRSNNFYEVSPAQETQLVSFLASAANLSSSQVSLEFCDNSCYDFGAGMVDFNGFGLQSKINDNTYVTTKGAALTGLSIIQWSGLISTGASSPVIKNNHIRLNSFGYGINLNAVAGGTIPPGLSVKTNVVEGAVRGITSAVSVDFNASDISDNDCDDCSEVGLVLTPGPNTGAFTVLKNKVKGGCVDGYTTTDGETIYFGIVVESDTMLAESFKLADNKVNEAAKASTFGPLGGIYVNCGGQQIQINRNEVEDCGNVNAGIPDSERSKSAGIVVRAENDIDQLSIKGNTTHGAAWGAGILYDVGDASGLGVSGYDVQQMHLSHNQTRNTDTGLLRNIAGIRISRPYSAINAAPSGIKKLIVEGNNVETLSTVDGAIWSACGIDLATVPGHTHLTIVCVLISKNIAYCALETGIVNVIYHQAATVSVTTDNIAIFQVAGAATGIASPVGATHTKANNQELGI
ncbi:MAG: right-handed parallel beta-helix repeat-containing protein [Spirochaetes bacterium]|nr:right-handed parallel beta-helix repeat-containing protein [Spirochaetota bacterium]